MAMLFSKVRRYLHQALRLEPLPIIDRLPRAEEIHRTIARERARADRTRESLCVVTFEIVPPGEPTDALNELASILEGRLRLTDELGSLGPDRVCAVLPNTSRAGAAKVVEDVLQLSSSPMRSILTTIYSYPWDDKLPSGSNLCVTEEKPATQSKALEMLFLKRMPFWKRGFDLVTASLVLVACLPLLLLVAIAIKLTSRGPVFFCQLRSGLGGQPFWIYKLRTMTATAEAEQAALRFRSEQDGPAFKIRNDPRITWLGAILRKLSIDELPQLWNVILGDMTLVGPRPLPCRETAGCEIWQRQRLDVTPGLTCIWQISGRSQVSFDEWVRMDVQYIRSRSILQDLKLILLTIPAVFFGRGAC